MSSNQASATSTGGYHDRVSGFAVEGQSGFFRTWPCGRGWECLKINCTDGKARKCFGRTKTNGIKSHDLFRSRCSHDPDCRDGWQQRIHRSVQWHHWVCMVSAVMTIGIMADSDGSVLQRDQNGSCDLISFVFVRLKHILSFTYATWIQAHRAARYSVIECYNLPRDAAAQSSLTACRH